MAGRSNPGLDFCAGVAEELGLYYFVPAIRRVHEIKDELGFLYWTVDTDKGERSFVMRNNVIREAREVSRGHWLGR